MDKEYNYLLVSSRKNEIMIYEIIQNVGDFGNTLKKLTISPKFMKI